MKVCLLGVDFHSGNRGCGALAYAAVEVLRDVCKQREEELELSAVLFAHEPTPIIPGAEALHIECVKVQPKKISYWKKCKQIFKKCDVVIDFTGGDSFSDLYGLKRFCIASVLKELAIRSKAKFIMGPQTIGPFKGWFAKKWAKRILKKSDICFARDSLSAKYAEKNCGVKVLLSTDVAFALPYKKQEADANKKIKIGFNPSGLLWDGTKAFSASKHITVDYKEYVCRVMGEWHDNPRYEIHLIPHVFSQDGIGQENDMRACMEIQKLYPDVIIDADFDTPMEAKSVISKMDVFIGARMHATIAAFSTGVATIPFSYSRKFEGLYNDLNYEYLISATSVGTDEAVEKTLEWVSKYQTLKAQVEESSKLLEEKQNVYKNVLLKI